METTKQNCVQYLDNTALSNTTHDGRARSHVLILPIPDAEVVVQLSKIQKLANDEKVRIGV